MRRDEVEEIIKPFELLGGAIVPGRALEFYLFTPNVGVWLHYGPKHLTESSPDDVLFFRSANQSG